MLKIAHRGASGYQPENTILSFNTAVALGANAIEFDVRKTQDGHIVVIHDSTVDRTTNGSGLIRKHTLGELSRLDAGKEERIPTLEKVFETFGNRIIYNIELKESGIADQVMATIRKHNLDNAVIVSAFSNWADLFWLKCRLKSLKIALLAESREWAENAILAARTSDLFPVYGLNLSAKIIDRRLVKQIRETTNCKIFAWTCNEVSEIESMKKLKVDGIFSDFPDRL